MRKRKVHLRYGGAVGAAVIFLAAATGLTAILLCRVEMSGKNLMRLSAVLWGIAGCIAGNRAGFRIRRHGILHGLLCGGCLCLLQAGVCLCFCHTLTPEVLRRCLLILPCSVIGCIYGTNRKFRGVPK